MKHSLCKVLSSFLPLYSCRWASIKKCKDSTTRQEFSTISARDLNGVALKSVTNISSTKY